MFWNLGTGEQSHLREVAARVGREIARVDVARLHLVEHERAAAEAGQDEAGRRRARLREPLRDIWVGEN